MTIIGFDPGYDRLGVAVFTNGKLIYSDCLTSQCKIDFPLRLLELGEQVEKILKKYQPNELALEEVFFNNNQKTALRVAEVRGMIIYLAGRQKIKVYQYSPQIVKMSVTGYGSATKDQIMTMVSKLVAFPTPPKYDDEYDAVAVGITHLSHAGHRLSTA